MFHNNRFTYRILLLVTFSVFQTVIVHARQDGLNSISVTAENDIYAPRGQDRHYTNGVRLTYSPAPVDAKTGSSAYTWMGSLFDDNTDPEQRYEFLFGQNIYTPEYDIYGNPASPDRPFAAWLYAGLSVTSHQSGRTDYLSINAGMVGPAALGRQSQNLIHNIVDDPELSGWEEQLDNEPGLLIRYRRSWTIPLTDANPVRIDLVPALGASLGNIMTDAAATVTLRLGNHQIGSDVPARLEGEHAAGANYFSVIENKTRWMLFASAQQRIVLRNIFLDGNTFSHSVSVEKRNFVNDIVTGIALGFGQFDTPVIVSFNLTFRGREFDLQRGSNSFGSVMIGLQY